MGKFKVGEYVRFNDGNFDKIIDVRDTLGERKLICFEKSNSYLSDTSLKNMQVKHSKNIIDLIEVGDYVNGEKVTEIKEWNFSKDGYFRYAVTCHYEIIRADEIKSIVTKEQFAQMEYRVKE